MTRCIMSEDCTEQADHTFLCPTHKAEQEAVDRFVSDECGCPSCRSDLARIVPCEIARPEAVERVAWLIANEGVRL